MQKKQVEQQNKLTGLESELKRTGEQIRELSDLIEKRTSEIDKMQKELEPIRDGKNRKGRKQKTIWDLPVAR